MTTSRVPNAESIEALRQALRTLVQEACDCLKDFEIPVRKWTRVVRNGENKTSFPIEARIDFFDPLLLLRFWNKRDEFLTFESVAKVIERDPDVAGNLPVDTHGIPMCVGEKDYHSIARVLASGFLSQYFRKVNVVAFQERVFTSLFQLLASELQTGFFFPTMVFPLKNLRISTNPIRIDRTLQIRNIFTEELEEWMNEEERSLRSIFPRLHIPSDFHCAIESLDMPVSAEVFDQFVNLLRLLTDTDVFAVFEETRCRILHGGHSSISIRPGMNPRVGSGKQFLLDENDANHLKKLWKNVAEGANKDKVRLPLKRMGGTADRSSTEDKLIDYWIALESLFAPESSSEIRYRAALRIASFLGEEEERTEIYRDIGLSYDFRSAVVHANRGRLANLEKKKAKLADITERTRGYLRRALLKILESDEVFDPQNIEHELLSE